MKTKGFTLLELMIVVAIIGILASVAIPGFGRYMRESKKSEAKGILRAAADGASVYYNAEHVFDNLGLDIRKDFFPGCETGISEPQVCADIGFYEGTRVIGQRISPTDPGIKVKEVPWTRLNISITKPFLYVLFYTSVPTPGASTFTARAVASLNAEDDSELTISGNSNGGSDMSIGNIVETKDIE
jgi:prepilin-type N-terminal cleavage/methylation domain-containing protein